MGAVYTQLSPHDHCDTGSFAILDPTGNAGDRRPSKPQATTSWAKTGRSSDFLDVEKSNNLW